jgi:hypothetical protein
MMSNINMLRPIAESSRSVQSDLHSGLVVHKERGRVIGFKFDIGEDSTEEDCFARGFGTSHILAFGGGESNGWLFP